MELQHGTVSNASLPISAEAPPRGVWPAVGPEGPGPPGRTTGAPADSTSGDLPSGAAETTPHTSHTPPASDTTQALADLDRRSALPDLASQGTGHTTTAAGAASASGTSGPERQADVGNPGGETPNGADDGEHLSEAPNPRAKDASEAPPKGGPGEPATPNVGVSGGRAESDKPVGEAGPSREPDGASRATDTGGLKGGNPRAFPGGGLRGGAPFSPGGGLKGGCPSGGSGGSQQGYRKLGLRGGGSSGMSMEQHDMAAIMQGMGFRQAGSAHLPSDVLPATPQPTDGKADVRTVESGMPNIPNGGAESVPSSAIFRVHARAFVFPFGDLFFFPLQMPVLLLHVILLLLLVLLLEIFPLPLLVLLLLEIFPLFLLLLLLLHHPPSFPVLLLLHIPVWPRPWQYSHRIQSPSSGVL